MAESAGPGCSYCTPSGTYVGRDEQHLFPQAWRRLEQHPRLQPGPWVPRGDLTRIVYCEKCEQLWYVFFDPKDMYFSDIVPLPRASEPALDPRGPLDEVLAWILDEDAVVCGRFVEDLAAGWFSGARYDLVAATTALLQAAFRPKLTPGEATALLRYFSITGFRCVQTAPDRGVEGTLVLDGQPLLDLTERPDVFRGMDADAIGYARQRMRNLVDDVARWALGSEKGLARLDDRSLSRLRRAAGKENRLRLALARAEAASRLENAEDRDRLAESFIEVGGLIWDLRPPMPEIIRPLVLIVRQLGPPADPGSGTRQPLDFERSRWHELLKSLYRNHSIPPEVLREVMALVDPDGLALLEPTRYEPLAPPQLGCRACQPKTPISRGDEDAFPEIWERLVEHPRVRPGGWVPLEPLEHDEQPFYCKSCGTLWLLCADPSTTHYECHPLPASAAAMLHDEVNVEGVMKYVSAREYRAHRVSGLRRLVWRYFESDYYDRNHAARSLLSALTRPGLGIDEALDLLQFFRLVLRGARERQEAYPSSDYTVTVDELAPALDVIRKPDLYRELPGAAAAQAREDARRLLQAIAREGLGGPTPVLRCGREAASTLREISSGEPSGPS